jgi:hypothetical protein
MDSCAACGHPVGDGRFCTHCGAPVDDWRTGTAERPAVPGPAPAPVAGDGPRYPLFADEAPAFPPPGSASAAPGPATAPLPAQPRADRAADAPDEPARRPMLPWVAGAVGLLLLAVLGTWLVVRATGDGGAESPGRTTSTSPGSPGSGDELARTATADVPRTAPPNQDVSGNMVRYEARNMLDGVAQTCWRMPGDGTGEEIVLHLPGRSELTSVGLVNGYAKVAHDASGRTLDWYHGNRRITRVEWVFDDGSTVRQSFGDSRRLQTMSVDHVSTRTVRLRLLSVSDPGTGRAARDYTAISDVSLVGSTA